MKGRKKQAVQVDAVKKKSIWTNWRLYVMCLPAVVYLLLFNYKPMYGIIIAFKNYSMRKGIMGSPWIGFANFQRLFSSYWFPIILKNTLTLSLLSLVLGFPIPIILALALNEVQHSRFRKGFQTISYAPHFISTVVMCGMLTLYLSPSSGIINKFIEILGGDSKNFLQDPAMFKWVYVLSGIWQEMGWGSIIYFATLSGVDRSLLEAAEIDGASRLQKIWYVNLPVLMPTILILLVLNCGSLLSVGYEKVFLLQNPTNLSASEVISTFVYKSGLDDWTQLADIEEYAKRLGIRLDCNFYETDWETQLTLMVAGDELPDLLTGCNMNIGDVNEWGGEGYFLDLGQYLDEMPNLQAYFEKYPEMKAFCSTSDGHIYGLPRLRVDMTDRLTRSFVNKVWLENLGLEVPTTIVEYYDVLTAFKNQDANGNGDTDDEIPLLYTAASGGYSAIDTTFLDAFGIFTRDVDCAFQADENGKVKLANISDNYKEFLKFMHKLYEEGLMEQEAFTITGEEVTTKEQGDVYGSFGCGSAPFVMAGKDISYDANWLGLSGLTSDIHSKRETSIASPVQNGIMIAVNANTQYPEAMARFLDYFYTDEGMLSTTKVPS